MLAVRPAVKHAVILTFFATLAAYYFQNTPIPHFLKNTQSLLLALLITWSAGGLGSCLLQWKKAPKLTPLETFLFSETLGLGLLSVSLFLFGIARAWILGSAWAIVILGLLASGAFLKNLKSLFSVQATGDHLPLTLSGPMVIFVGATTLTLILGFAPTTYYDSLVYHLALPAAYIQAQGWVGLPHLIYSAFPQTGELIWLLGLLIGNDTVVNLLGWQIGVLLLLAIYSFGQRFLDQPSAAVAVSLVALMPAFLMLTTGGYIDVLLTLLCLMSFYAACLWMETPTFALVLYAALCAGWAMGTKYTGGLSAFITALFFLQRPEQRWRTFATFVAIASVVMAPWLIKNLYYVGNPVFPFFYSLGVSKLNPWLNQAAAGYFAGITEYYSRSLTELPRLVWTAMVNGIDFGRGMDVLGDFGWLPLFALLPTVWLARKRAPVLTQLGWFSGIFFVIWAMNRPVLRFLFPVCPMIALLAAYGWVHGIHSQPGWGRWISRGFIGSFLVSGLFLFFYTMNWISPFGVAIGFEDRDSYLMRKLNYYGAASFINAQTPPTSHIYIFGDQRSYYYQRLSSVSPVFSHDRLTAWANESSSPLDFENHLRSGGITHLVVNRAEYKRLGSYLYARFNDSGRRIWTAFLQQRKPIYRDTACEVFAL